jgi:hypothetical protein
MFFIQRSAAYLLLAASCAAAPGVISAQGVPSVRRVHVLHGGAQVEIEIESTMPLIPQTNELGGPNRLLVDFINARPGAELRNQSIKSTEVRGVRFALFSNDPPVTRIVVDLNGPQPYQVFPSGRTTIIKIGTPTRNNAGAKPSSGNVPVAEAPPAPPAPPPPPPASHQVLFDNGLLSIVSDRASLSEILFDVHQRTGAEIAIPSGAEQEKVVVNLGPAPAPEVLAQLLNGSKFNFLILSSAKDPRGLDQVILTPRAEGAMPPPSTPQPQPAQPMASSAVEEPQPRIAAPNRSMPVPNRPEDPPTEDNPAPPPADNPQR